MTDKREALLQARLGTVAVPQTFAVTFSWGRDFWVNQENGLCAEPQPEPSWDDVEVLLLELMDGRAK